VKPLGTPSSKDSKITAVPTIHGVPHQQANDPMNDFHGQMYGPLATKHFADDYNKPQGQDQTEQINKKKSPYTMHMSTPEDQARSARK